MVTLEENSVFLVEILQNYLRFVQFSAHYLLAKDVFNCVILGDSSTLLEYKRQMQRLQV